MDAGSPKYTVDVPSMDERPTSDDESSAASSEETSAAPVECCIDGCTLAVKPSTKCWQLAARYGRFLARAQGLDDDAAPPLVLTRDGKVVPHSTLVSSLAGVELSAVGADGPISRPRPPPPSALRRPRPPLPPRLPSLPSKLWSLEVMMKRAVTMTRLSCRLLLLA